jgi:hypothetical protein
MTGLAGTFGSKDNALIFVVRPSDMSAHPLTTFIDAEPALKPLLQRLSELRYAQSLFSQNVPPALAKLGKVGSIRDGTLIIFADNGAAAAKLKQALPEITEKISRQLQRPIEVRVNVLIDPIEEKPERRRTKHPLSLDAIRSLRELAEELPASPLKEEVALLVARQSRNRDKADFP